MKHTRSPSPIENPPKSQIWQPSAPLSLHRPVSPPLTRRSKSNKATRPATAAVEAGEISVEDHVAFFSEKLLAARRPDVARSPRLPHDKWLQLYQRNLNDRGHHFVVHQHDHPVAGTHYDLRLQCNATSSISFAIMYGLPGDPNSRRLNRNATETRVHNLWNHLVETASLDTGTMLLWDTGEYEVLPYIETKAAVETDDEGSVPNATSTAERFSNLSEPSKLKHAFQRRKIKLRLHGTRLPDGYTLYLRLTKENYRDSQPPPATHRRKRKRSAAQATRTAEVSDSDGPDPPPPPPPQQQIVSSVKHTQSTPVENDSERTPITSDAGAETETEIVRLTSAHPGATNSINSVHQRRWYLSLDRRLSGFVPTKTKIWSRRRLADGALVGFEKFHVLGRDVETSVVTGRLARDILADEGVEGFVPRGLWRAVTE